MKMNRKEVYEMEQNTFMTESDAKYVERQYSQGVWITFVIFSLLSSLTLFVAWQTFAFCETIVLIVCVVLYIQKRNLAPCWRLSFENDELTLFNLKTGERFEVYDIPATDFVIRQSAKDKELDYCDVLIKNTIFAMGGVKNCTRLKAYIDAHYPQEL